MKADTLTLKALFQKDVRYVIPTFQRPYVWNQEDQWEPLWDDVRNAAERYLDEYEAAGGDRAIAEERAGSHFMGAVVLKQRLNAAAELETRDVIDGQQRLTTMQLLMDAAQEVFERRQVPERHRLARLVQNSFVSGDDVFKLWPTSLDQEAYRAAMTNEADTEKWADSLVVQAHEFFQLQIAEWVDDPPDDESRDRRIHGLETALLALLEMVVIDLGAADDPFVIFETLNTRGTPLLASDLVKNFLIQTATASSPALGEEIYERQWRDFEDDWWRADQRQGRIIRPRIDAFINYWLVCRTGEEVQVPDVFPAFKRHVEASRHPITEVAADLGALGRTYQEFDAGLDPWTTRGTFRYRWGILDIRVTTPVLLWLLSQPPEVVTEADVDRCLAALESYLVRRLVCRMTTKDYNKLFLDLLNQVTGCDPGTVADTFVGFLLSQESESRLWPADGALRHAIVDLPLYRLLTRSRLRMVLEALEDSYSTPASEAEHVVRGKLTIEHVLPQKWRANWPLSSSRGDAAYERDRVLHTLGNLTLVTGKLNPTLSNGPWTAKRGLLEEHSILHLNKKLLAATGDGGWDEAAIGARSIELARRMSSIWPRG